MNKLLSTVGIIYGFIGAWLAFSWLYILIIGALTGYTFFSTSGDLLSPTTTLLFVTGTFLGGAIIHCTAAYGIWKKKRWARTLSLILGSITVLLGLLLLMTGSIVWAILYSAFGGFVITLFSTNNDIKTLLVN